MTSPSAHRQHSCPLPDQLRSFSNGDLGDDETIEQIGVHLEQCTHCLEQVEQFSLLTPATLPQGAQEKKWEQIVARELDQAPRPSLTPPTIGKYPIHQILAYGGMSTIYESVHPALGCPVVVKALSGLQLLSPQSRERLLSEQLVFGRLQHETIVSVLDAGQDGEIPYIVMERLQGQTLSQWIKAVGPQNVSIACAIGTILAEALAAIHTAGFVHCDVKPNNIMRTETGTIKLLDFGLATHLEADKLRGGENPLAISEDVISQEVGGTPNFIPPEHLFGDAQHNPSSDLYGLGVTLIYLLSGKVLQTPKDDHETERFLSLHVPAVPQSLRNFLSRLVSVNPENRPKIAAVVQSELFRYIRDTDSIRLSHSIRYDVTLAMQRRRLRLVTTTALLLFVSISGLFALRAYSRITPQPVLVGAETNRSLSAPVRPQAESYLRTWPSLGLPAGGLLPLVADNRAVPQAQLETYFPRPGTTNACWSHQGDRIACMGSDGSIRVYELSSNAIDNVFVLPAFRSSDVEQPLVAWSADDQTLAVSASVNDGIQFWDVTTRRLVQTFATEIETCELAFAKQSGHFVAGNARGDILVLDKTGTLTHTFPLWDGKIPTGLACSADGRLLAATNAEGGFAIIDSSNWEVLRQTELHRLLTAVAWCSTENHLVVGTEDGDVIKFNFALENVAAAQLGAGNVVSLAWDQETNKLAVGSESCIVCDPDLEVIEEVSAQHYYGAHRVHWNDGRLLVAALHRGLYLFDAETRENTLLLPATLRQILSLAWHPSKDLVAVGTMGGTLLLANHQGTVLSITSSESTMSNTSSLRWSPDGRFVAGASSWGGRQLRIWNDRGEIVRVIEAELGCLACDWFADGQYLAAGGEDDTLTIYRAIDGSVASKFDLGTLVRTIDCHPTEPVVAVGTENGCHLLRLTTIAGDTSSLNDTATIEPVALWEKGRSLRAVAFSPQGDRLAIAAAHGTISILRYPSEHLVQRRTVDWWGSQELKWNHSGTQIACGNLGILDANALHTLSLPNSSNGYDYAWSLEDTIVISGDWIENLTCFDARDFQPIWQITVGKDEGTVTLDNQGRLLDQHGPGVDLLLLTPNPAGGFDASPLSFSQE